MNDTTQEAVKESNAVSVITTPGLPEVELNPNQKQVIAMYVESQADLLGFCLKVSREKFANVDNPLVETEESIRSLATSLYIAVQRKFQI